MPDPQAGGYTMFFLDGKMVAAAGPTFDPHQVPAWATYICSRDAAATSQAIQQAGGQVLMGPMDVMGQGRMAVCCDPTGAHFSIWEPQNHRGAELVNVNGSFCWNELYTRDIPTARSFYGTVFGWKAEESDFSGGKYTTFQVAGKSIAGGLDMSNLVSESVPPHWLVYFTVENTADTVSKAEESGATVVLPPHDTPMGPIAVLQDPVGAMFAVIQVSTTG